MLVMDLVSKLARLNELLSVLMMVPLFPEDNKPLYNLQELKLNQLRKLQYKLDHLKREVHSLRKLVCKSPG